MNSNHCSLTGKHDPVKNQSWFQCRYCHKKMEGEVIAPKQTKFTDKDDLYKKTVEYYLKKNYPVDQANKIAESVVTRYLETHKQDILLEKTEAPTNET